MLFILACELSIHAHHVCRLFTQNSKRPHQIEAISDVVASVIVVVASVVAVAVAMLRLQRVEIRLSIIRK